MNLPVKRVENRTGDQKYWSYSVDSDKTRIPSNIVLLQGQATAILAWIYGMGNKKQGYPQTWFYDRDRPQRYSHGYMAWATKNKDTLKHSSATGTGHCDTRMTI